MADTAYTTVTWTAGDVITEAKLDSMVANDRAYDAHSDGLLLTERTAPGTPSTNNVHVYAKDDGAGVSALYYKDDAGNETQLGAQRDLNVKYADDYATIADAVNDLVAGDTLVLSNKEYTTTSELIVDVDGVTIMGNGSYAFGGFGSRIKANFSTSIQATMSIRAQGVKIINVGFTIQASSTFPTGSTIIVYGGNACTEIKGCYFSTDGINNVARHIDISSAQPVGTSVCYHTNILNCYFYRGTQQLVLGYAQRSIISQCQFQTAGTRDYNLTASSSQNLIDSCIWDVGGLNDGTSNLIADYRTY